MAFKKGEGGRPKGAKNRRTKEFMDVLEAQEFCPASALIACYHKAIKVYDSYGVIYDAIVDAREKAGEVYPLEDNGHKYLKIAADIAEKLSSYAYPKLKSIDQNIDAASQGFKIVVEDFSNKEK